MQEFAWIDRATASKLLKLEKWMPRKKIIKWLRRNARGFDDYVVPNLKSLNGSRCFRIKVVTLEEMEGIPKLETIEHGNFSYAFATEPWDLCHRDCKGILLSVWGFDDMLGQHWKITYDGASILIDCFRLGFGSRDSAGSFAYMFS